MIINDEVMDRLVAIEIANLESRLAPYARREGNPSGVYIQRFGRATAFVAEKIPARFFNSVLGVGPELIERLDEVRAFYRAHGVECAMEIVPGRLTEPMALELAARGFVMVGFHVGLARALSSLDPPVEPAGVTIEELDREDPKALERFLDTYLDGWGTKPAEVEDAKSNMRAWRDNREWRFYLARVDGEPAGAAVLDTRGKTAMLASASTRDAMRGRRVQAAMIDRRMRDAARAGCDLLIGGAYYGTSSMRNQQRAGLVTACTKGIWIDRGGKV